MVNWCEIDIFLLQGFLKFLKNTLEQTWSQFVLVIFLMELELINFELELEFPTKELNPQINLPFNFLIQKYFFHDNPGRNINYSV